MAANDEFEDLGFAKVDTDRERRCGFAEVIYCQGKSPQQVAEIAATLAERHGHFLATRADQQHYAAISAELQDASYHEQARCVTLRRKQPPQLPGSIVICCAGTSDMAVAEEACVSAEALGCSYTRIYDIGVAGIHRLLARRDEIEQAMVAIVVAGMEGALPSAVAGLVTTPVIAVPTSVGYGASFGGVAALLGMLNSCGSGVTVVNIDNGFGAAYAAASFLKSLSKLGRIILRSPSNAISKQYCANEDS